jgi:hypothetical protein
MRARPDGRRRKFDLDLGNGLYRRPVPSCGPLAMPRRIAPTECRWRCWWWSADRQDRQAGDTRAFGVDWQSSS